MYIMYKLVKGGPLCGSCANKLTHLSQYPLVGVNIKSNLFMNTFFVRFTCLICSIQNKSCSLCLSGGPKMLFTLTAEAQRGRGGINKDRRQHLYHTGRFSTKKSPWQPTICQPFLSNRATPMNWCLRGRNREARLRMSVWQFLMANSLCWISLIIFNTCAPLWQWLLVLLLCLW